MREARIELTRHPIKLGRMLPRQDNPLENIGLPFEGIIQAKREAEKFASEFVKAPNGTLFWTMASNKPRTQEAAWIFERELASLVKTRPDIAVIDLEGQMPATSFRARIEEEKMPDGTDRKIVLINGPVHPALGENFPTSPSVMSLYDRLDDLEAFKAWAADPGIGRSECVGVEEIGAGFSNMIERVREIGQEIGRNIVVKAFGHSGQIEAGIAAVTGLHPLEILEDAGGTLINTLEHADVMLRPNRNPLVRYRQTLYSDDNLNPD